MEVFREAIGQPAEAGETIASMVERHYTHLKEALTTREGGALSGAQHVRDLLQESSWADFANYGLAASYLVAPSAPIMRTLFALLRKAPYIDDEGKYGAMLRSLGQLALSGSFVAPCSKRLCSTLS